MHDKTMIKMLMTNLCIDGGQKVIVCDLVLKSRVPGQNGVSQA